MNSESQTSVIAKWVIFTSIGSTIGLLFGSTIGNRFGYPWGIIIEKVLLGTFVSLPSNYVPSMVAGFTYGAVLGFCLGFLQWIVVLQSYYRDSILWVLLNTFGYALETCLSSGFLTYIESTFKSSLLVYLIFAFIGGPITGLLAGSFEWIFFRSKHKRAIWWLILIILGWTLLKVIGMVSLIMDTKTALSANIAFAIIYGVGIACFTGSALYITFPRSIQETDVNLNVQDKI